MRTIFTQNDMRVLFETLYNTYSNKDILITDENNENQQKLNLGDILNTTFYTWKNRLITTSENQTLDMEEWLGSINDSIKQSFALVEMTDITATASQDINAGEITGKITFLIQADKTTLLEQVIQEIRNAYLGSAEEYTDKNAQVLDLFITLSPVFYDSDIDQTQFGESIICYCNYVVNYLQKADTYEDTTLQLSINNGTFATIPLTKASIQNIFTSQAVTTQNYPNRTGQINTAVSMGFTLSFFDFNLTLANQLNLIFWKTCAYAMIVDGSEVSLSAQEINVPCKIKAITSSGTFLYNVVIMTMNKEIVNGDFNTNVVAFRLSGK